MSKIASNITVAVYKSRHRYRSDSLPALGASAT
jgi:hypothetical protein